MKHFLLPCLLYSFASLGSAQTYLSPHQLGSGTLPVTYASLVFSLSDGNGTPQFSLPDLANDKAHIKTVSSASGGSQGLQAHTDVPMPALSLASGQALHHP